MTVFERLSELDSLNEELKKVYNLHHEHIAKINDEKLVIAKTNPKILIALETDPILMEIERLLDEIRFLEVYDYVELWSSKSFEEIEKELAQLKKDKALAVKHQKYEISAYLREHEKLIDDLLTRKKQETNE